MYYYNKVSYIKISIGSFDLWPGFWLDGLGKRYVFKTVQSFINPSSFKNLTERREKPIEYFSRYKMRPILPTLKEKKRYILFETTPKVNYQKTAEAIEDSCFNLMGSLGCAKAGIQILDNIIRVDRKYADHVRASLALINTIDDKKVIVKSVKTSGAIKGLKLNKK